MKRRTTRHLGRTAAALAAALLAGMLFGVAVPAAPLSTADDGAITRQFNLGIGKSVIVDLPRDAAEIFVAAPDVANAVVRSPRRLYIIAVKPGETTIFAVDAQGRQIAAINVSIGEVAVHGIGELAQILKAVMPRSNIVLRTVNDTIILTGEVDSDGDAQRAEDIAKGFVSHANGGAVLSGGAPGGGGSTSTTAANGEVKVSGGPSATTTVGGSFDGKIINALVVRGKDQVMLKVTIAEVQHQVLKQLGITNSVAQGSWGRFTQDNGLPINGALSTGGLTGLAKLGTGSFLSATLQAFERDGVARVLAEPTVTAVSGESAKFTAGGQIPIPQGETCTTTPPITCAPSIQFKDYGVTLNFTPVVLSEGRILLRVATEVTDVDPQQSVTIQNVSVPGFRSRKNETSVELPSGGSIVSAGLIQVQSQQVMNGLPGLMNLPILGQLFRSRDYQRQETELMIIVTPYIAKPVRPNEVARPDDGFADSSDPQAALLGHVNRIYSTTANPGPIQNFKGHVGFIND